MPEVSEEQLEEIKQRVARLALIPTPARRNGSAAAVAPVMRELVQQSEEFREMLRPEVRVDVPDQGPALETLVGVLERIAVSLEQLCGRDALGRVGFTRSMRTSRGTGWGSRTAPCRLSSVQRGLQRRREGQREAVPLRTDDRAQTALRSPLVLRRQPRATDDAGSPSDDRRHGRRRPR